MDGEDPLYGSGEPRDRLMSNSDVVDTAIGLATEGLLSTNDLWWLYDEHGLMAPADAWLLVAMWEENLDERLVEITLADPGWWASYDWGPTDARRRDRLA